MAKCIKCGAKLDADDIGAHLKFVSREAHEYMCVKCLAVDFGCPEEHLRDKIEFLRENGCLLFPQKPKN